MRKHKKHPVTDPKGQFTGTPESNFTDKSGFSEIENPLVSDDGRSSGNAKKETSGIWFLAILAALLLLVFLQHWLRQ